MYTGVRQIGGARQMTAPPRVGVPPPNMGGGIPNLKMSHLAALAILMAAWYGETPFFLQVAEKDLSMEWL